MATRNPSDDGDQEEGPDPDAEPEDRDRSHQIRDRSEVSHRLANLTVGGREFVCAECNARCTESPRGDIEYGHLRDCDHSSGRIERNGKTGRGSLRG